MMRLKILFMSTVLLFLSFSSVWALEIERPHVDIDLKRRIESVCTNGEVSVGLGVAIDDFDKGAAEWGYRDCVTMNVSMPANSRLGITYSKGEIGSCWIPKDSLTNPTEMFNVGDDWGMWVNFSSWFVFRFYGGKDSAEYRSVWVSSNGFISFDLSNSTSPYPTNIPWDVPPNALIAALWTDLQIDSSASIITGLYERGLPGRTTLYYFVITWNNALHKQSGTRLTFQIALEMAPSWSSEGDLNRQSDIRIDYHSVNSINTQFSYGIEDLEGLRGNGGRYNGADLALLNGKNIWFKQNSNNFFLNSLVLRGYDVNTDANASTGFVISRFANHLRGYHINTGADSQTDRSRTFLNALTGTATFLLGVGGVIIPTWPLTLPISFIKVTQAWADHFAYHQYSNISPVELRDEGLNPPVQGEFYIKVPAQFFTVDASMDIILYWIMPSDVTQSHSLTLTAELQYYEYNITSRVTTYKNVTTSVNVKIGPDNNNSFDTAYPVWSGTYGSDPMLWLGGYDLEDFYIVWLPKDYSIRVIMTPPTGQDFDLYLYSSSDRNNPVKSSKNRGDAEEIISYGANIDSDWFIKVKHFLGQGFYTMTINIYGRMGNCPYVYAWNGSQYVIDNNILPTSEVSNGTDVEDYYKLEQALIPTYQGRRSSQYSLQICEFESEHSYLDQVKLFAVNHDLDVNIALTPDGEILTYKNPAAPMLAFDNNGTNRLNEISRMDGNVSDPATYFDGFAGDYLTLNFGKVNSANAKLIVRDDRKCLDTCIDVQVKSMGGEWVTVETLVPRAYWAIEAVDLSPYITKNQDFWVRLLWTSPHRLDYVGLDTTRPASYELQTANLVSAIHSVQGDVKALLLQNDNNYAELIPGEQIQLEFTMPNNSREARTYIFCTEGYYFKID